MSIRKQYIKGKSSCRVTFRIDETIRNAAKKAHLVGEFNGWSPTAQPMRRTKTGGFAATIDLPRGKEYQFRYLLDQQRWENDPDADKLAPTPYADSQNSVVVV